MIARSEIRLGAGQAWSQAEHSGKWGIPIPVATRLNESWSLGKATFQSHLVRGPRDCESGQKGHFSWVGGCHARGQRIDASFKTFNLSLVVFGWNANRVELRPAREPPTIRRFFVGSALLKLSPRCIPSRRRQSR